MYTRIINGRAAWRTLYSYFFGMNAVQTQTQRVVSTLDSLRYEECHKNFTFDTYVLKNIKQHNIHNELVEHGADSMNEGMKTHYFQAGIVSTAFDSVKNAILADPDKFQTFDCVKDIFMNFHRSRPKPEGPAWTRAIASIRGRHEGRGGPQGHGAHKRDCGRGSRSSDRRRDGLPLQIEVDRWDHIQDRTYMAEEYAKLTAPEKQRLYQIQKAKGMAPRTKGSNRSVSLAQTDNSSNHKRSATNATLRDDVSEDNGSLFPASDGEITDTDKCAKNRANAHQPSR
jgi:hypothetical protein